MEHDSAAAAANAAAAAAAAQLQQQLQQQLQAQQAHMEQLLQQQQAAHQHELQRQQQAFFAQMQQLMQQQQQPQQQAAAAALPAAAAAAPSRQGPRLAPPSLYDGRANTLDDWLEEMVRQFEFYATPDGAEQIRIAAAHLGAAARAWWADIAAASRPADWAAMKAALRARFQPITTAEAARARLRSLTQGKSSVHDYVSAFRRLMVAVPDMSDADRLFCFKSGLRPAIATHLTINHANASTLAAAVDMAVRIGSLGEIAAAQHAGAVAPGGAGVHSGATAMDLDALANVEGLERETDDSCSSGSAAVSPDAPVTRSDLHALLNALRDERRAQPSRGNRGGRNQRQPGLPRVPHLTEQQVREYLDAGKCFGCGVKTDGPGGHYSNKCPRRQTDANGRVSWSK